MTNYSNRKNISLTDLSQTLEGETTILDKFRYIEGRRFHNVQDVVYCFPCDKQEINCMVLSHILYKNHWKSNFSSPIYERLNFTGTRVLDVGCGSGIWTIEMANDYPKTTFLGIDISSVFPIEDRPCNAGFLEHNILDGLPFPAATFDCVFQRNMFAAYTDANWLNTVEELVRVTKPNGFIEFMENDIEFRNQGPVSRRINNTENSQNITDVTHQQIKMAVGGWGGENGDKLRRILVSNLGSLKPMIKLSLGIEDTEWESLALDYNLEVETYKTYITSHRIYARKGTSCIVQIPVD
ncbi:58_t:CDS:2 [Ambispora gerdemannii]|uniref:58_t:CDS:1 n=1 Tax=Ambispora gerdemannii TaxID=144530 RepID=A0A9N9A6E5_9GLOM|nr:58_t:CDS:2 [Ambispora gerdemannii]